MRFAKIFSATLVLSVPFFFARPSLAQEKNQARIIDSAEHRIVDEVNSNSPPKLPVVETNRLEVRFDARANDSEAVISIVQARVAGAWSLQLNGSQLAAIKDDREPEEFFYEVPAGKLKNG